MAQQQKVLGKTIQIFLPDGNPRSMRIAEITSRTVQAILIPRSRLEDASDRDELSNVGVYFLVGSSDENAKPLLYVGEAEDCRVRLKQQNKAKDFWNSAVLVVSKTKYFTKSHIKYLEWFCYEEAKSAGRYQLENSTVPTRPYISEAVEADLQDNFETIRILISTLGFPLFDHIQKPQKKNVLVCKGKDAYAEGEYTEDGLIVFANSTANLQETKTAGSWVTNMHAKLVEQGILQADTEVYRFTADHVFSSPSEYSCSCTRSARQWMDRVEIQGRQNTGRGEAPGRVGPSRTAAGFPANTWW